MKLDMVYWFVLRNYNKRDFNSYIFLFFIKKIILSCLELPTLHFLKKMCKHLLHLKGNKLHYWYKQTKEEDKTALDTCMHSEMTHISPAQKIRF